MSVCVQVPVDPISKVPGLLDALKLMDCAVQQNMYHDKLLMYRNVRMPQKPDQVLEVLLQADAELLHSNSAQGMTPSCAYLGPSCCRSQHIFGQLQCRAVLCALQMPVAQSSRQSQGKACRAVPCLQKASMGI